MNAEQKLLPCPWCHPHGSAMPYRHPEGYWAVTCGCGAEGPATDTEAEAIASWNTRPAPTEAEVEAAAKRMWRFVGFEQGYPDWEAADESEKEPFRRMARAALAQPKET